MNMEENYMATILGTIVNPSLDLIGFKIRGKNCEIFKGHDTTRTDARLTLQELIDRKIKTSQVDFSQGRIIFLGGFKPNTVGMEMANGGQFIAISNAVTAIGRIVKDGKDVGYNIRIDQTGDVLRLSTQKLDRITDMLRPTNFVVRHDAKGTPFVAAKSGSITTLPVTEDLSAAKAGAPANAQATGGAPVAQAPAAKKLSFEEILNLIGQVGGQFAYVPGFAYNARAKKVVSNVNANETFLSGQLANPVMLPTVSSANVNLRFRGLTNVKVKSPDTGNEIELHPFLYREKSVYRNGKLNLATVGVLVPSNIKDKMVQTLAFAEPFIIDDAKLMEYFGRMIDKTPAEVCLIGISLIGVEPFAKVNPIDYAALAFSINCYSQMVDALKACNTVKKEMLAKKTGEFKEVHSKLKDYSQKELSAFASAGIDVKHYTYTAKAEANDKSDDSKTPAEKVMKLEWTVELSDKAEAKKLADIADLVTEAQGYADADDADRLIAHVEQLDKGADGLKKAIWEANKFVLKNGNNVVLPKDANGVSMVDATSNRMKTSKKVVAKLAEEGIKTIILTIKNAEGVSITL